MSLWMARWRRCRSHEQSPSKVLAELWRHLRSLPSKLGHFSLASAGDGVPPGAESSVRVRSDDLLPIDLREVATYLLDEGSTVANSVASVLNTLNYLALCSGHAPVPTVMPERPLTNPQKQVIDHVRQALSHLENSGEQVAPFARMADELREAKFDYAGEPILMMEDLDAEQVIAAWPAVGQAAVQEATAFLPDHIRDKLNDPRSCLLPLHEWPSRTPVSKVRASDEEWHKVVVAAHERGLMVPLDPEDVFKDASGVPVLNGAGAVPKFKTIGGQKRKCQRFISNLIPSNAFQARIDGDDKYLPYLGQLTLLEQESDQVWLTDSEDFTSSFNLFKIPAAWHNLMGFGKLVDASAFGGPAGRKVYPAIPMGWLSSVAVVQAIVRSLVFDHAAVLRLTEVTKMRALPDSGDLTVIYLDSFDELRRLEKGCKEALDESMSDRHARFLQVCREKGLPLNESKRLVASTRGTLQGGLLDGDLGRYGLSPDKMANLMGLASSIAGHEQWSEFMLRHLVGKATFGMCFRRTIFSVLQGVFSEIQCRAAFNDMAAPAATVVDEVLMVLCLVPMMFTSLKAALDDEVAVTDASPSGGGAAVATRFKPPPLTVDSDPRVCHECGSDCSNRARYPCPAECGAMFCSLACVMGHRDVDRPAAGECPRRAWRPPRFGERFSGPRAPLSHAVALEGRIEVQPPFDLHFGLDMFTDHGRSELQRLMDDEDLVAEHCAPECKLFSKARGRPITLEDGRTIQGPQPVRDGRHLMGFPWLPHETRARVRQSNNMVLKALKRGKDVNRPNRYWTVEHPYRSWMWDFTLVKELEQEPDFSHAVGSSCCFGGQREKWFSFFGDLPTLPQHLAIDCPGHQGLLSCQVTQRADGTLVYPTEEEAEYPWRLCTEYAAALTEQLNLDGRFDAMVSAERERYYLDELAQSTGRLAATPVKEAVAATLVKEEAHLCQTEERAHLRALLRAATYRGTDVRFFVELDTEDQPELHEVPYLALRWDWKTILAFPWKEDGHINELELNAVAVYLKRRSRSQSRHGKRYFHVLDSMVTRGCLAKGRSSSRRLNQVLRKCTAHLLASDDYMFPLWTISRWNFADKPSRLYETQN